MNEDLKSVAVQNIEGNQSTNNAVSIPAVPSSTIPSTSVSTPSTQPQSTNPTDATKQEEKDKCEPKDEIDKFLSETEDFVKEVLLCRDNLPTTLFGIGFVILLFVFFTRKYKKGDQEEWIIGRSRIAGSFFIIGCMVYAYNDVSKRMDDLLKTYCRDQAEDEDSRPLKIDMETKVTIIVSFMQFVVLFFIKFLYYISIYYLVFYILHVYFARALLYETKTSYGAAWFFQYLDLAKFKDFLVILNPMHLFTTANMFDFNVFIHIAIVVCSCLFLALILALILLKEVGLFKHEEKGKCEEQINSNKSGFKIILLSVFMFAFVLQIGFLADQIISS